VKVYNQFFNTKSVLLKAFQMDNQSEVQE